MVEQTIGAQRFSEHDRIVEVGPYDAAVVHDGALPNGARTYHLFWSDGATDFVIAASTQPAEAVDVARSLYCGTSPTPAPWASAAYVADRPTRDTKSG